MFKKRIVHYAILKAFLIEKGLNFSQIFLFVAITLLVFSCKSDKPILQPNNGAVSGLSDSKVLVVNEGLFQYGNSSLTYFDGSSGSVTSDVYKAVNKRDLGDVAQSATVINNKIYVVVNNSNKVEVLDKNTFRSTGTISGLVSPRYIVGVGNSKAYISDIYSGFISIVDLNRLSVTGTIPCPGWTEQMLFHRGRVYVCNYWKPYLYVINPEKDVLEDSIFIGPGANSIVADKYDRLVIASGGYKTDQKDTRIVIINPVTKAEEGSIYFPSGHPSSLNINPSKDSIYFLNTAVYKMPLLADKIPDPFISAQNHQFYSIGLDLRTNHLFVSDAIDYLQQGKIYIFNSDGKEKGSFDAGLFPGNFCFF